MKKLFVVVILVLALGAMASPVFAQAPAKEKPPERVATWIVIASGFSMAIASAFCGMAQAKATSSACESLARNPGATAAIRFALILALVLIESMALYTFAIIFAKVTY